nr:TMV resistance protein N-like [Malus domestica]
MFLAAELVYKFIFLLTFGAWVVLERPPLLVLYYEFEASCFLANVSAKYAKHGPNHVRDELLGQILKEEDLRIDTPSIGSTSVQEKLHCTNVFVVPDAVDEMDQIELLAGDDAWFGPGSRIIITTRDKSLLEKKNIHDSKIYRVQGLPSAEALTLFNLNAFRNSTPQTDYAELSGKVLDYVKGLPL